MIADAHVDILLELAHREHRLGETNVFARTWLPLLEAGGVGLQVCPVFVDLELQPEGSLREALRQVTALQHALQENPDRLLAVRSRADLDAVEGGGRIGLMLALEGVEPFGYEVATADLFWELGLRMAGLTWNRRNPFADGAADEGGLSRLGRALLARFAELGVILDLAHASPQLYEECLESYEGRICVTHAGCREVNETPRNLSDQQLRELAARDGIFGLMLHPLTIDPVEPTIGRVVDHLEHAASVIGPERVCLGGDWTKRLQRAEARVGAAGQLDAARPRRGGNDRRALGPGGVPRARRSAGGTRLVGAGARRPSLGQPLPLPPRGAARLVDVRDPLTHRT